MKVPEVRYAKVGDSDVAFQVAGEGPDVLFCYGLGFHTEMAWTLPACARGLAPFTQCGRLITFDRRGTGGSGRLHGGTIPTWEELAEDMGAVLDAVGSDEAAIISTLDAGPMAMLYSAMHPERVRCLILRNTTARLLEAPDYPIGISVATWESLRDMLRAMWGTEDLVRLLNESFADDPDSVAGGASMNRASATPREAIAQYDYFARNGDVRQVLSLIRVPTLIHQVQENPFIPVSHGRYLAEHIPGATLIETPGSQIGFPTDDVVADFIEFLTGVRPVAEVDRILTTVLFTDIVGSTELTAAMGDRRWHAVLDSHDQAVREQLRRYRGFEINTTGDGFFASFDGPARAIRCASAIVAAVQPLAIEVRAGLHSGECEIRGGDLGGLAVHIAARVGALAKPSEVLVSGMVKDLVAGSAIRFDDRGEHELRGVPGVWRLHAVAG